MATIGNSLIPGKNDDNQKEDKGSQTLNDIEKERKDVRRTITEEDKTDIQDANLPSITSWSVKKKQVDIVDLGDKANQEC